RRQAAPAPARHRPGARSARRGGCLYPVADRREVRVEGSTMKRYLCSLAALGLLWGVAGQAEADYVFTTLDPPGTTFVTAFMIKDAAQIVGRYADAGGVTPGFLVSADSSPPLDPPGSADTGAFGINASGQIVGRYTADTGLHGFLLSGDSYTT